MTARERPITTTSGDPREWPARLKGVPTPQGELLVPEAAWAAEWREVDWWSVAWWYLDGLAERAWEKRHGPIHSYSLWLREFDSRMWDKAWVNRIALLLRSWSAQPGEPPRGRIWLTHDVDAIRKTPAIRLKQTAFHLFNAVRRRSFEKLIQAVRFFLRTPDYWAFEEIQRLEETAGVRSLWLFYGGGGGWLRRPRQLLFDPDYDVQRLDHKLRELLAGGWQVGLHQAFGSWAQADLMRRERERVERAAGAAVTACRQHWLRFSWERTWAAQEAAGFTLDHTLGFNDRPGFRNGAALRHRPQGCRVLDSIPMVLMDSQLYDYGSATACEPWIDEVLSTGGEASVIWHAQVFNEDYDWGPGYRALLATGVGA